MKLQPYDPVARHKAAEERRNRKEPMLHEYFQDDYTIHIITLPGMAVGDCDQIEIADPVEKGDQQVYICDGLGRSFAIWRSDVPLLMKVLKKITTQWKKEGV